MKTYDVAVVGQGISGILLTRQLQRAGKYVIAFDDADPCAASHHAAAILNPVNLGKLRPAMRQTEMDAALEAYVDLSATLNREVCTSLNLYAYLDRSVVVPDPVKATLQPASQKARQHLDRFFHRPEQTTLHAVKAWKINFASLQQAWLAQLKDAGCFYRECFNYGGLKRESGWYSYKGFRFRQVIFCEGLGARQNPFFPQLHFTKNRGDYLLLDIPGLPKSIYHYGQRLVPREDGTFWYGSNYQWDYENLKPDAAWKAKALEKLNKWLNIPFRVLAHQVAERPTTPGQAPILEQHSEQPGMYLFNGLGTKGFTRGPGLAADLVGRMAEQ